MASSGSKDGMGAPNDMGEGPQDQTNQMLPEVAGLATSGSGSAKPAMASSETKVGCNLDWSGNMDMGEDPQDETGQEEPQVAGFGVRKHGPGEPPDDAHLLPEPHGPLICSKKHSHV